MGKRRPRLGYLDAAHRAVAIAFEIYAPTFARVVASRNHFPRVVRLDAISPTIAEDYEGWKVVAE